MRKLAVSTMATLTMATVVVALGAAAAFNSLVPATLAVADEPTTVTMFIDQMHRHVDMTSLPVMEVKEPF